MRATCAKPASPLGENAFFRNQSGKVGRTVRIRDLLLEDATAKVILGGNTLTISSREHKDGAGWDPGATVDDSAGGEIVWKRPNGLLIYVK